MSRKLVVESSGSWRERFNLITKFKKFCQWCTSKFEFWCLVGSMILLEPILCSKYPSGIILKAQVACLGASSILYIIQLIGVASREWERIIMIEAMSSLQSLVIPKHMMDLSLMKVFIFFSAEGEYILEFFCLAIGWIFIFWHPGLAALRCFRPFRLLWFYEVEIFRSKTEENFNPIFGDLFVSRGFRVLKFAIKALSALGNEMFRLTADTKGGLLLMMIFFYAAFVLGTCIWIEMGGNVPACTTAGTCMYTMVRLALYDTNGFDFAYLLVDKHKILFFIVMMYMCITSFGIINGLTGIFGTAFQRASDLAFEDEEDRLAENEVKAQAKLVKSSRNLYADDSDDEDNNNKDKPGAAAADSKPTFTESGISNTTNGNNLNEEGGAEGGGAPGGEPESPPPKSLRLTKRFVQALQDKHVKRGSGGAGSASGSYQSLTKMASARMGSVADSTEGGGGGGGGGAAPSFSSLASLLSPRTSAAGLALPPAKVTALVNEVHRLERSLENQTRMMENMMEHIDYLQKQIHQAYFTSAPKPLESSLRLESFMSVLPVRASDDNEASMDITKLDDASVIGEVERFTPLDD